MIDPNFFTQAIEEGNYGKFILEPLPLSFAHSLGHALRRTLLSSLKGAVVTQVKIEQAPHLFTTVSGIKESILDIVLNIKQLRFSIDNEKKYKLNLNVKGIKKVYSQDIKGEISPVNKDFYLFESTDKNSQLDIELIVESGYGYVPAEEINNETGFIALDASFSPVKKVNFKVEEARIGRKSNFERLILEIETDGSISPKDALKQSSSILAKYFNYILTDKSNLKDEKELTDKNNFQDNKFSEIIIDELNLPSRVINALLREKIETVADLIKVGKDKLVNMKGVGKKSIELINEELKKLNISLN